MDEDISHSYEPMSIRDAFQRFRLKSSNANQCFPDYHEKSLYR